MNYLNSAVHMRPSRTLRQLRAGQVVSCFKTNLSDARAAEIAALSGFDCFWTDMEHIGNDWSVIERQIWATKAHDMDTMVRVSRGSYSNMIRALELDAAGIMVPHVMSLEDAQEIVRMTRFHPVGRRSIDGGNSDAGYSHVDFQEYLQQANAQRFLALQIEDPEVMTDLEAIAALDGVDLLFFGPADFSQGIGAPGQWNNPKLTEARRKVAEACLAHGKFAATLSTPETLDELIAMGYRFLHVGSDITGIKEYCQRMAAGFAAATERQSQGR